MIKIRNFLAYLLILILTSPLVYNLFNRIFGNTIQIVGIFLVVFVILSSFRIEKYYKLSVIQLLSLFLWIFYTVVIIEFLKKEGAMQSVIGINLKVESFFYITLFLVLFSYIYYISINEIIVVKRIMKIGILSLALCALMSFIALDWYPNIIRIAAGRHKDSIPENIWSLSVATYPIIYMLAICFPIVIETIINTRGRKRIFSIISLGIFGLLVYKSLLTTALFAMIFGIILYFLLRGKRKTKFLLIPLLIIMLLMLYSTSFMYEFIYKIASLAGSEELNSKLYDIAVFLESGNIENDLNLRLDKYIMTLKVIPTNIVLGAYYSNSTAAIGGHATILDLIASTGLMGFIPFLMFIIYSYKVSIKRWGSKSYGPMIQACFTTFVLIALTKSITSSYLIFLSIVLIIPSMPLLIEDWKEDK